MSGVAQWGPAVYMWLMWGTCGIALVDFIFLSTSREHRPAVMRGLVRSLPWAIVLALGLALAMVPGMFLPDYGPLQLYAGTYAMFALFIPVLWTAGEIRGEMAGLPRRRLAWSANVRALIFAALVFAGILGALALFLIVPTQPGELISDMTGDVATPGRIAMVLLLMVNAPWQEELLWRHFMIGAIVFMAGGRRGVGVFFAVVVVAAVFAVGHAGHLVPAWSKLIQMFAWGLMLGWARVELGTGYAIGLHLLFNLSAPIMAMVIGE